MLHKITMQVENFWSSNYIFFSALQSLRILNLILLSFLQSQGCKDC